MIPSAGPSFGRLMDQAAILRRYKFPCVMALPSGDPSDAVGLERGLREFAERSGTPLVLYLKDENNFGADKMAGLDAVARMLADGTCVWIKYAVVRSEPKQDSYLEALLSRVDKSRVVSGIGERPAVDSHARLVVCQDSPPGQGVLRPWRVWTSSITARRNYDSSEDFQTKISAT